MTRKGFVQNVKVLNIFNIFRFVNRGTSRGVNHVNRETNRRNQPRNPVPNPLVAAGQNNLHHLQHFNSKPVP